MVRGTLSNGLSYYIRHNEEPRDRAQIALVVKAGSVHEDEDQRGLAHFAEHMAFNGTERFAKQEIVEYLESIATVLKVKWKDRRPSESDRARMSDA